MLRNKHRQHSPHFPLPPHDGKDEGNKRNKALNSSHLPANTKHANAISPDIPGLYPPDRSSAITPVAKGALCLLPLGWGTTTSGKGGDRSCSIDFCHALWAQTEVSRPSQTPHSTHLATAGPNPPGCLFLVKIISWGESHEIIFTTHLLAPPVDALAL